MSRDSSSGCLPGIVGVVAVMTVLLCVIGQIDTPSEFSWTAVLLVLALIVIPVLAVAYWVLRWLFGPR